jgi:hypothetical protein
MTMTMSMSVFGAVFSRLAWGCARRLIVALVLAVSVLGCWGSSQAFASSPWWHLSAGTLPSYLQPGRAADEVQQVTVGNTVEEYVLAERGVGMFGRVAFEEFEGTSAGLESLHLRGGESPAELQAQFEHMYGTGNVEVSETTTPAQAGEHLQVYRVKWMGRFTDLPVGLMYELVGRSDGAKIEELVRGRPDGELVLTAVNLGDAAENPQGFSPVTISDRLPKGLRVVAVEGSVDEEVGRFGQATDPLDCSNVSVSCEFTGLPSAILERPESREEYPLLVPPYHTIVMRVAVNVEAGAGGASTGVVNEASITGGGVPGATAKQALTVSDAPIPFGASSYEVRVEGPEGGPATQAGSHPFQVTVPFGLNATFPEEGPQGPTWAARPLVQVKDLHFKLPAGLIGDATAVAQCPLGQFLTVGSGLAQSACPAQTVVGVLRSYVNAVIINGHILTPAIAPIFNVEPAVGEPARFGVIIEHVPVVVDTSVRAGGDYGATASVDNTTQHVELLSSEATFWGVPGDEAHNDSRGYGCLIEGKWSEMGRNLGICQPFSEPHPAAFFSLPTSCSGGPLVAGGEMDSWEEPHNVLPFSQTAPMVTVDGCDRVSLSGGVRVSVDGERASTPTGLGVDAHFPQGSAVDVGGLAESAVRDIAVTLPAGVALNPSAADGLQVCSEGQAGFEGFKEYADEPGVSVPSFTATIPGGDGSHESLRAGVNFCPDASKVGTVRIKTPLLPNALEGAIYLASPQNFRVFPSENPFESLVSMYVIAEDPVSGSVDKSPGRVILNEATGQIEAVFEAIPQVPVEDIETHFFGGERSPLVLPARCGTYTTNATFTPWSGNEAVHSSASFQVTSGPDGGPCPSGGVLPFAPVLQAGVSSTQAGAFTPLSTTISREDGQQALQGLTLHYPPGLLGVLRGVSLCGEAQANAGTCPAASQIGESTASVGAGNDPFTIAGGKVFITGPYDGAPFGLSVVTPTQAGPFVLQEGRPVVVRARIEIDPHTAALTIVVNGPEQPYHIPTILQGIPLLLKHVNVLVNRPGFTFNPTSCTPTQITGTATGDEGTSASVASRFQAGGCGELAFHPSFKVSTSAHASKHAGASLDVRVNTFSGQANIAKTVVTLPKQLPARLTTIQQACTEAQFAANPAGCPVGSVIGTATATTPLIAATFTGPAYLVSHGGAAFPNVVMILQGEGVVVQLTGGVNIKHGITTASFESIPDTPITQFELSMPEGPHSGLAANLPSKAKGDFCGQKLTMPTILTGQNGAQIKQNTKIAVTGCPKPKKKAKHTKKGKKKK